jgi:hypothetical protein
MRKKSIDDGRRISMHYDNRPSQTSEEEDEGEEKKLCFFYRTYCENMRMINTTT